MKLDSVVIFIIIGKFIIKDFTLFYIEYSIYFDFALLNDFITNKLLKLLE